MILEGISLNENISLFSHELDSALRVISEFANNTAYSDEDRYDESESIECFKQRRLELLNSLYNIHYCMKLIRAGAELTFSELEGHSID